MSENPDTLREARDRFRLARARARAARAEAEARVLESLAGHSYTGGGWGDWVDPRDAFRDADLRQSFLGGSGRAEDRRDGRDRPWVESDLDLDRYRALARHLHRTNDLAIGALNTLRNFTIKKGFAAKARPAEGLGKDPAAADLAAQVQRVIDQFQALNRWPSRQKSAFVRSRRDGEAFIRTFDQRDGTTRVRFVEPEQIRTPMGSPRSWSFGIEVDPDDVEDVRSYAVSYEHPDDWEQVPACDVSHFKLNVDENVKRGCSDFFSSGEALEGASKLLRNLRVTGAVQAAVAWIEQFESATENQLADHVARVRDLSRPAAHPLSGREPNYQHIAPGSVPKVSGGRTYINSPLAQSTSQHIAIVQACLRAVGTRWNMPEYMISGDASNANYASSLVSGSPFVNSIECEQDEYAWFFLRVLWVAVRNAVRAGRVALRGRITVTFELVQRLVDVDLVPPKVSIENNLQDAQVDDIDLRNGVISRQHRRAKLGLDDAKMRQELAEEPVQAPAPQGVQPPGLQGGYPEGVTRLALLAAARLAERRD